MIISARVPHGWVGQQRPGGRRTSSSRVPLLAASRCLTCSALASLVWSGSMSLSTRPSLAASRRVEKEEASPLACPRLASRSSRSMPLRGTRKYCLLHHTEGAGMRWWRDALWLWQQPV